MCSVVSIAEAACLGQVKAHGLVGSRINPYGLRRKYFKNKAGAMRLVFRLSCQGNRIIVGCLHLPSSSWKEVFMSGQLYRCSYKCGQWFEEEKERSRHEDEVHGSRAVRVACPFHYPRLQLFDDLGDLRSHLCAEHSKEELVDLYLEIAGVIHPQDRRTRSRD